MESTRDIVAAWAAGFAETWRQTAFVGHQLLDLFPSGREAMLRDAASASLAMHDSRLDVYVEMRVSVCADGRPAKTAGRVDVVCTGPDGIGVAIELKMHPLSACSIGPRSVVDLEANGVAGLSDLGLQTLKTHTVAALAALNESVNSASLDTLFVVHRSRVPGDADSSVFVVRCAKDVVDGALRQAAFYAESMRANSLNVAHANGVESMALVAFGERIVYAWN